MWIYKKLLLKHKYGNRYAFVFFALLSWKRGVEWSTCRRRGAGLVLIIWNQQMRLTCLIGITYAWNASLWTTCCGYHIMILQQSWQKAAIFRFSFFVHLRYCYREYSWKFLVIFFGDILVIFLQFLTSRKHLSVIVGSHRIL